MMSLAVKALLSVFLSLTCIGVARAEATETLVGTWSARPEVRGQVGELVIHFESAEDRSLGATLELPQIQSQRIRLGEVQVEGSTIRIGPMVLEMNAEGSELSGIVPQALIPNHKVQAVFRKSDDPVKKNAPRHFGPSKEPVWKFETEAAIWGGVLVAGDALYFGNDDGDLFALDANTGALLWKIRTGGIIRSQPSEVGNDIVVQSDDGYLYRVNKRDGSQVWKVPLARGEPGPVNRKTDDFMYDHYASSVNVSGGVGYVGTYEGDIVCVDLDSGNVVWRFASKGPVLGQPAAAGDLVIGASWDSHVYALNAATGELVWRANVGGNVVSSPAVHDDAAVLVGTRGYDLIALDLPTGERKWDYYFWFSWVEPPPLVIGDIVFAAGSDGGAVLAFDAQDGTLLWEFDTTGSIWAPLTHDESMLYVGAVGVQDYIVAHEPGFFAIDLSSGDPIWSYLPDSPSIDGGVHSGFAAAPAVGAWLVYAGSLNGNLYAFRLRGDRDTVDAISTASPQSSPDAEPDY
ncbi:MAG: PQQ-binding-like beta-propeller repeat protein [Gammaproteobacteria bacterium]|nr:PQQ-binding-like beta-propeller repeat protein [Gammaproteobacteria bacterium]